MKITGVIWLEDVVDKIAVKHRVFPEEVEEALSNRPKIKRMNKGNYRGEDVYRALGRTRSGRYLVVFFIHKRTHEALVLSSRDMDRKERKQYARK